MSILKPSILATLALALVLPAPAQVGMFGREQLVSITKSLGTRAAARWSPIRCCRV